MIIRQFLQPHVLRAVWQTIYFSKCKLSKFYREDEIDASRCSRFFFSNSSFNKRENISNLFKDRIYTSYRVIKFKIKMQKLRMWSGPYLRFSKTAFVWNYCISLGLLNVESLVILALIVNTVKSRFISTVSP